MGFLARQNHYISTGAQHLVAALFPCRRCFSALQDAVPGKLPNHHCLFNSADCSSDLSSQHVWINLLLHSRGSWLLCLRWDHSGSWQSWGVKENLDVILRRSDIVTLLLLSCWRQFDLVWSFTLNQMDFDFPLSVLLCIFASDSKNMWFVYS